MRYPFLLAAALALLSACGEKKPSAAATMAKPPKDTTKAPSPYFPVTAFLKGEIAYVDSLPIGIKKYYGDNKNKYTYIKPEEFHRLASEFIPEEIQGNAFQEKFKETAFMDQSNGSGTLLYTPKDPALRVQRIDVLTMKGDVYDQVKSIYLQKNDRSGDTTITKKLYWRPKQSFQIITERATGTGKPAYDVINVVWDTKEEE